MELWIGALNLGLLYGFMAIGVFITFRVHNFPDITVDGSFTAGASTAAFFLVSGVPWHLSALAAFFVAAAAGCATALIHTRFKINGLLAGILVMTGLYSINLHIMGRANIPLLDQATFQKTIHSINPGMPPELFTGLALAAAMTIFWLILSLFFKTDLGLGTRMTGDNPDMAAATGVNVDAMKIFGVTLANGLAGLAGALVAQYQGFADIGMGVGTIVTGLAAVIIGESLLRTRSITITILSVILGSVIFRLMIAAALFIGMNPIDLKLLTAGFVLVTLILSKQLSGSGEGAAPLSKKLSGFLALRGVKAWTIGALALCAAGIVSYGIWHNPAAKPEGTLKIGILQVVDHNILNITRDSFVDEMAELGYIDGENVRLIAENANGDLPTVNTILDKFLKDDVDVVLTISTPCTQAAISKIKDRPVVFATVSNPFIIGAGRSDTDHLSNVTGIYGSVPMDKMMEMVRRILPGKLRIGVPWDPSHANSVYNVEQLMELVELDPEVTFVGSTISGSSEVYQVALSLVNRDIDAFVLSPDNTVYSAFESVVKAARMRDLPIFLSDVDRLKDGALAALGHDYSLSGIQAARIVDRILKGEKPSAIPFEQYRELTVGINLAEARRLGITISQDLLAQATTVYDGKQQ